MLRQTDKNRLGGAYFERVFAHRARMAGCMAIKNPLAYKRIGQGKSIAVFAELDFTLVCYDGRIAFVDAKQFQKLKVTHSQFTAHQIDKAVRYNHYRVAAGFAVHFVAIDAVYYFSGLQICAIKGGRSLPFDAGVCLGPTGTFDVMPIFETCLNGVCRGA